MNKEIVYVISDSVGETAELVVKAAACQFFKYGVKIKRVPYIENMYHIDAALEQVKEDGALIAFTIVVPEIKEYLVEKATEYHIPIVDILGPVISTMEAAYERKPLYEPRLVHKLDADYFHRIEAMEFAVKYDDGRDPRGILQADIVLIGVSRTSKTPLSQYLALKRYKVANVPIFPEVKPPEELFEIDKQKCFGLYIHPKKLNEIRLERLKALGLNEDASYANYKRIEEELIYFKQITDQISCPVIDVTNKAVEETANMIVNFYS
ncbi:pyruvate, water dikinase regulatory protein [Massilibacterium senegalense]|uniref:pyruvate, water dikinase regulatory protein n=1 Tax=Massilibacterium senegalense TaxID=1632858 RepID=UPI0007832BA6|nr:pyruvate, water dikinase regulatory protein [Massilibacterium senegalense]